MLFLFSSAKIGIIPETSKKMQKKLRSGGLRRCLSIRVSMESRALTVEFSREFGANSMSIERRAVASGKYLWGIFAYSK